MVPIAVVFGAAILDWFSLIKKKTGWENWSKPLVMVMLGVWYFSNIEGEFSVASPHLYVLLAVLFSLFGDMFLLPKIDNFIAGLLSFLLAHVLYIVSMQPQTIIFREMGYVFITGLMMIVVGFIVISKIVDALLKSGKDKLKFPVIVYGIVLVSMFFLSLRGLYSTLWNGWQGPVLAIGGFLFFLSDVVLAWNRFVEKVPNGSLIVRVCYQLGQIGIVSALLAYYNG